MVSFGKPMLIYIFLLSRKKRFYSLGLDYTLRLILGLNVDKTWLNYALGNEIGFLVSYLDEKWIFIFYKISTGFFFSVNFHCCFFINVKGPYFYHFKKESSSSKVPPTHKNFLELFSRAHLRPTSRKIWMAIFYFPPLLRIFVKIYHPCHLGSPLDWFL